MDAGAAVCLSVWLGVGEQDVGGWGQGGLEGREHEF
jgi:hypothetical protein